MTCQRCGEPDADLRTLRMACTYMMDEIGLPFGVDVIDGRFISSMRRIETDPPLLVDSAEAAPEGKHRFYTLEVCKLCRADWMRAIKGWFDDKSRPASPGSGIFIRDLGATREISEAEWAERVNAIGHWGTTTLDRALARRFARREHG